MLLVLAHTFVCEWSQADTLHEAAGFMKPAPGKNIFQSHCSPCHDNAKSGAPAKIILTGLTASSIYSTLTTGRMRGQASNLTDAERREVAEYLSQTKLGAETASLHLCESKRGWYDTRKQPIGVGWGMDLENTRRISSQEADLTASSLKNLQLKWAFSFPNTSRVVAQPLLAGGGLFVGSADGTVYALSASSGCAYWTFNASGEIQGGLVMGTGPEGSRSLYFADRTGHVYSLDANTGEKRWRMKVDEHPAAIVMGTPVLLADRLYIPVMSMEENAGGANYPCCTFRGSLVALNSLNGQIIWKTYTIPKPAKQRSMNRLGIPQFGPSGAGLWSSPTIDVARGAIFFTTGNGYSEPSDSASDAIFAVDLPSGRVRWHTQTLSGDNWTSWDYFCRRSPVLASSLGCPSIKNPGPDIDFTTSPVLVHGSGKDILVAGRKDGTVFGVDPDTGSIEWTSDRSSSDDLNAKSLNFGLMADRDLVLVPSAGTNFPNAGALTPAAEDGLLALNAFTGRRVWTSKTRDDCDRREPCTGITFAPIGFPGVAFAGDTNGYVRAYDTKTGAILWRFDTTRTFTTVNGTKAHGGAISRNSIAVGRGMVFVGSGNYTRPGSVLLAFQVSAGH